MKVNKHPGGAFKKGHKKFGGRKKGTQNKTSVALKDAILQAFNKAGGVAYLVKLAKNDPRSFTTLLGRVLPAEIKAEIHDFSSLLEEIAAARKRATGR